VKAMVVTEFGGPETMKYMDVDIPSIGPNQVLIRVKVTSVNFADIKSRYGKKGGKLPFIPGIDVAGVIAKAGEEVEHLKAGQRVIAFPKNGSYAEYVVADENLTFEIPEDIDFETAAASPIVSFLSYKLLADIARLEKGETVLVHAAAGGVGTTAIQLAKILGARQIFGTVGSEHKKAMAMKAGADQVICYETEDFAERVNGLTNGQGVDVILDSVAGNVTEQSLICLAPYGRLVNFGNSSGQAGSFTTKDLHSSCRSVLGFSLGTTRTKRPELLREIAPKIFAYLKEGSLEIEIGQHFALQEAGKAHEWIESRQSVGKVLLHINAY
jgi:NADPH:quinone reductase